MRATNEPAVACILLAGLAGGCATIVEGTDQTITVSTNPAGAICELTRVGQVIGSVNSTPGSVSVDKSTNAIVVTCDLEGYETASRSLESEFEGMTVGNVLFGGVVGVGVDAASGAMNEYPSSVTLTLQKLPEEEPTPVPGADDEMPIDGLLRPEDIPTS